MNVEITESPINRRDRTATIALTVFCQSFQALATGGIALLLPLVRQDLRMTFTQGGTLAAAMTLVYAAMQIPAGYLADRFSHKRLFIIGISGTIILSLTFGLVQNYWQALANQAVSGVFRSLLFAPGMAIITGLFPSNRRATATGLYLVGGATGNVIFNSAGPLLVAWYGWRFAFISVSSLGLIAVLLLMAFGKDPQKRSQQRKGSMLESFQLFRYKLIWVTGALQFIRFGVIQGITFWLPSLLINEKGLSLQLVGIIVGLQYILMAPGNVIGGYLSDRFKNPILVMAISLVTLSVTILLIIVTSHIFLLAVFICLNAVFLQMYFGPLFSIPVELLGATKAGIATGIGNLFASLGALVVTYLLGSLKDSSGAFKPGFLIMSGACIVGLALTLALRSIRHQALHSPPTGIGI